jgi:hypothetical protein
MGRFKEISIQRLFGDEHSSLPPIQRRQSRSKKPIDGQISIDSLIIKPVVPLETRVITKVEETKENKLKPITDSELPVDRRYLNSGSVAFINPNNIIFIKNNFYIIGKNKILGDALTFCRMTDEEITKRLVVFPDRTILNDPHSGKEMFIPGGILALPLKTTDDWGFERQSFMYIGNFSQCDEKRNQKNHTSYKELLANGTYKWRNISAGQELPANYHKALRIQLSVSGANNIVKI